MVDVIEVIRDPTPVVEVIYPAGPQGGVGPPPTLQDGTTATLPPGSNATSDVVTVDAAAGIYQLDFGIPEGVPGADSTVPGPQGPTGPAGPGVATGGTTGQLLTKTSATDFATAWLNPAPADLSTVPLLAPADDQRNAYSGAAGRLIISSKVTGDAQPRFTIGTLGIHNWGPGNAAPDTTLARNASAPRLETSGAFYTGLTSQGVLYLGSDGYIAARYAASVNNPIFAARLATGDVNDRFRINANGNILWGDGTNAADVTLYRSGATVLNTTGTFALGTSASGTLQLSNSSYINARFAASGGSATIVSRLASGDVNDRFQLFANGQHNWGDGTAALDTTLARSAAARLALTGMLTTTLGVATRTKAGTPADADWATAPPDGTIVVDTTASKIWARIGGVWKQTVALT